MNRHLQYDFKVDKNNKTILVEREFAAAPSLIWDAYTRSEILDQWWAPQPWKARTASMDFREGGKWHYAMVGPEGEEHWAMIKYITIKAKERFTGIDCFADSEGNVNKDLPESEWEVSFKAKDQNTMVNFQISFSNLAQLETTIEMGFKEGLSVAMEGLDELLKTLNQNEK